MVLFSGRTSKHQNKRAKITAQAPLARAQTQYAITAKTKCFSIVSYLFQLPFSFPCLIIPASTTNSTQFCTQSSSTSIMTNSHQKRLKTSYKVESGGLCIFVCVCMLLCVYVSFWQSLHHQQQQQQNEGSLIPSDNCTKPAFNCKMLMGPFIVLLWSRTCPF